MLTIRPTQIEAFRPTAESAFLREVVEYVRQEHDDQIIHLPGGSFTVNQLPPDILREMVCHGIERARSYGMTWESSITSFVVLMFVAAPSFDEHPIIARVLKDDTVEPDLRVDGLWKRTSDENWESVARRYDASAWGLAARGDANV
jgi:hypothetical protein